MTHGSDNSATIKQNMDTVQCYSSQTCLQKDGETLFREGGGSDLTFRVLEALKRSANCHQPASKACRCQNDKGNAEPALPSLLHQLSSSPQLPYTPCHTPHPGPCPPLTWPTATQQHPQPTPTHAPSHSHTQVPRRAYMYVRGGTEQVSSSSNPTPNPLNPMSLPLPTWDDDLSQADVVVRQEIAAQQVTRLRVLVDHVTSLHNKVDDALGHVVR